MNIKINKKFVSLLLIGGIGFSLCNCGAEEQVVNLNMYSFDELISSVEDNSEVDEALENDYITLVDPLTGDERTMSMMEASRYLEKMLQLSLKLQEMGIDVMAEDDEVFSMLEEEAYTWTMDDAYDFIEDVYYDSEGMKKIAIKRLELYMYCLDKRLRTEGVDITARLLEDSLDAANINDEDNYYGDILYNINNIKDNKQDIDYMSFYDIYSLLRNMYDISKEVIFYSDGENAKILTKTSN